MLINRAEKRKREKWPNDKKQWTCQENIVSD